MATLGGGLHFTVTRGTLPPNPSVYPFTTHRTSHPSSKGSCRDEFIKKHFHYIVSCIFYLTDSCGDTVIENTTSGRIESPNYPNSYANNLNCSWTIRVGDLFNVRLTFEGFNLESGYDQLIIEGVMEDGTVVRTKQIFLTLK